MSQIFSMNQFRLFSSKRHIDNLWFCLGLLWSLKAIFTLNAFTRANGSRDKSSLCAPIKKVIQALNYTRREFCLFFLKSCPHPQDIHIQSVLTAEEVRLKHTHRHPLRNPHSQTSVRGHDHTMHQILSSSAETPTEDMIYCLSIWLSLYPIKPQPIKQLAAFPNISQHYHNP